MALQSPGVQVSVVDESYYTPNEAGTTPLIVVASAQNKKNASGTGIAAGTLAANAGKVYKVTSQRELADFFGTPIFKKTLSGSPRHGDEQNEYGLQAAYSFLGVSNSAYIVRADINLDDLTATALPPGSEATDGQWWLDTNSTAWGVFEWDATPARLGGQKFVNKNPIVITVADTDKLNGTAPATGVGKVGDYAVVTVSDVVRYFYKGTDRTTTGNPISWQQIGTAAWRKFWPTWVADNSQGHSTKVTSSTFKINGRVVSVPARSSVDDIVGIINALVIQGVKAANLDGRVALFITGPVDSASVSSTDTNLILLEDGDTPVNTLFGLPAAEYFGPELSIAAHTSVPQWKAEDSYPRPNGSVWTKATDPNLGARFRVRRYSTGTKAWSEVAAPLYATPQSAIFGLDKVGGGVNIPKDAVYVQYNYSEDFGYDSTPQTTSFKLFVRKNNGVNSTSITSDVVSNQVTAGSKTFVIRESVKGSPTLSNAVDITFTAAHDSTDANTIAAAINASALVNVRASVSVGKLTIYHTLGGEFRIRDVSGALTAIGFDGFDYTTGVGTPNLYDAPSGDTFYDPTASATYHDDWVASSWLPLAGTVTGYVATHDAPLNKPAEGQRWYSNVIKEIDILVHNGTTWVGYLTSTSPYYKVSSSLQTDPTGPIVSATRPLLQSDGTALQTGDLWIDSSDIENFPVIYKFNNGLSDTPVANRWVLVDKNDTTSENGILFADARWGTAGTAVDPALITDLLSSNYLDPDTPDPALYPRGMLLWNTRRTGFNIKVYRKNYIDTTTDNKRTQTAESMINYNKSRWVTDSGKNFGRHAQRAAVVQKLKGLIESNQEIRESEIRGFNLIACPGYPETLQDLVTLNADRGDTAFVVGDSPFRLPADSTTLSNYAANVNNAPDNDETSLVTNDAYTAVFYPSGLTTDNLGNTVMVPSSHMMLKTIALSDQVSYPWFAPAGIRRGAITNATSVGYLDSATGEFKTVALTDGQRDTLYNGKVNPITFFNAVGLVNYGQRTRASGSSALDRINVARLVVYLRSQLNKLAKPYVFEPNDKITRDEIKQAVESLLLELVGLRAIYDYAVVCDETNNTPARIDRNELYVDVAIEPVKSIEFIYIPLRLKNTGEIQGAKKS
jgi:Phage tail sheath C-terminal domain